MQTPTPGREPGPAKDEHADNPRSAENRSPEADVRVAGQPGTAPAPGRHEAKPGQGGGTSTGGQTAAGQGTAKEAATDEGASDRRDHASTGTAPQGTPTPGEAGTENRRDHASPGAAAAGTEDRRDHHSPGTAAGAGDRRDHASPGAGTADRRDHRSPGAAAAGTGERRDHRAPARSGDGGERPRLLEEAQADRFRGRWHQVQSGFVDDPSDAVRHAEELAGEVVSALGRAIEERKRALDEATRSPGGDGGAPDTESLRQSLRAYRDFVDRMLAL